LGDYARASLSCLPKRTFSWRILARAVDALSDNAADLWKMTDDDALLRDFAENVRRMDDAAFETLTPEDFTANLNPKYLWVRRQRAWFGNAMDRVKQLAREHNIDFRPVLWFTRYLYGGAALNDSDKRALQDCVSLLTMAVEKNRAEPRLRHTERDAKTEARDKWIYSECRKLTPYKSIIAQLRRKPKTWERIESVPGIKRAAEAYATRHNLELPPARKRGRKPR
jgi:hypothetical protein